MKKLLVLTAVAALVATTAVEARGGFGGARGFSGGRSFSKSAPARVYAPSREKLFLRDTFMHPERPRYRICREVGIKEHLYPEMLRRALNAIAAQLKLRYTAT